MHRDDRDIARRSASGRLRARVNLSRRRVRIVFDPELGKPSDLSRTIHLSGYHNFVLDPDDDASGRDPVLGELVKCLAVAGFAAGNIMLFSVSIWSGANEATRDLFHWISALIALPAIVYAGRPFFRSAWRAVRVGRTNMDVPISIGVILASLLSLYETIVSGEHAYFDASITLLFFLLTGRVLDHLMRERARSAITNLAKLAPPGATRILEDGSPGVRLSRRDPAGDDPRDQGGPAFPVDATIVAGDSAFDLSIVNGESAPQSVGPGATIMAGAANVWSPVQVRADARSSKSFLARMAAMMEAAEGAKTRQRRIADRAASVYAPVVHVLALATFAGWWALSGDLHAALLNAVAVLIITCPCALALAVPIVHVVAAGRLFAGGILMKDGAALERAAEVERVVFDKTGTLTFGKPYLVAQWGTLSEALDAAATLADASTHPLSRAIVTSLGLRPISPGKVTEVPGRGMEMQSDSGLWRLGTAKWCGVADEADVTGTQVWLTRDSQPLAWFRFADIVRPDAARAVTKLRRLGLGVTLLSGDRDDAVSGVAAQVGIADFRADLLPDDKVKAIAGLGRTMMVGDGINDAPALRAAHASMAPSSAADIGRTAADFVFTGEQLSAVPLVITTARRAAAIVNQNLILAIGYNAFAVPLAISGLVTPLIAAIAMSSSSLIVVLNALRLAWRPPTGGAAAPSFNTLESAG